jgi:hypothetical protein
MQKTINKWSLFGQNIGDFVEKAIIVENKLLHLEPFFKNIYKIGRL